MGGPALGGCGDIGLSVPATVTAASYVLADLDTGAVLAARAPHARERPASTLKILTSLVVVDRLSPDTVIEGTASDLRVDGSKAGIGPGGRCTVRQLMAALLLSSGNDAAEALARALGGDTATVAAMTATAQQYGALDTRPATPSGLDGPGMASSAYDLAVLFRVALTKPLFASTIATRMVPFPGYGDKPGFMLGNNDRFVPSYAGAIAAKSGFTDAARHTLVATAQRGNRRLVVALMRGEQHPVSMVAQASALLDLGFATPPSAPAVGTLVDRPPAPPTSAPGHRRRPRPRLPVGVAAVGARECLAGRSGAAWAPLWLCWSRRLRHRGALACEATRRADGARRWSQRRRRSSAPSAPAAAPAPKRPTVVPPLGREPTTTSDRITAGPGHLDRLLAPRSPSTSPPTP